MGFCVCAGAVLTCSFGAAPSTLIVTPENKTVMPLPMATIMDSVPMKNIMPFGMCSSIANPTVAAKTAASLGVLTPMPCIPATAAPWLPGSATVMLSGKPVLNDSSKTICTYGGSIQIINAGTAAVQAAS